MPENRKNTRYKTQSHAWIPGALEGRHLLKDISITGCCMECTAVPNVQEGVQYHLEVEPERISHIGRFQLQVENKWIHQSSNATELGFSIVASPTGRQFQNYVDFLSYRSSHQ